VSQGAIWSFVYFNVCEGKVAIQLTLDGELDVGMDVIEVVKEIIQLFWSMRPDHKCVTHNNVTNRWACRPPW
jgi:hypothetical protein